MPSFAELKAKAEKAKDAGVTKFQNTRDRHTSVPLKKTNWDPYSGKPPPPPPAPRSSSASSSLSPAPRLPPPPQRTGSIMSHSNSSSGAPPPPPVKRGTRPTMSASSSSSSTGPPSYSAHTPQEPQLDWSNLSREDKEVFFAWLDEFFERSYGIQAK